MEKGIVVGIIGDFDRTRASHVATNQALLHASFHLDTTLTTDWLSTPLFENLQAEEVLRKYDGIIASPGAPYKSMEGALNGIKAARELNIPFIAT